MSSRKFWTPKRSPISKCCSGRRPPASRPTMLGSGLRARGRRFAPLLESGCLGRSISKEAASSIWIIRKVCSLSSKPPEPYLGGALVGKRSALNQKLMEISIRTGSVLFLAMMVSLPLFFINCLIQTLRRRSQYDLLWVGTFFIATAWLGFIVALMPFVVGAYTAGYWLPRLVIPAIMLFVVLFFSGLDRYAFFRHRIVASTLLCLIVGQSLLHFTFLWMHD